MWFFRKKRAPQKDVESTAKARETNFAQPSTTFTRGQLLYLIFHDAIPGLMVTATVNLAISYVMYVTVNTSWSVWLFRLPKSLAGDAALTIIVHCIGVWFIKFHSVHRALRHGAVQAIGFVEDAPLTEDVCWLMFLSSESGAAVERVRMNSFKWIARHILRASLFATVYFLAFWPASVIGLMLVGDREANDFVYSRIWVPQVFKTLLGGMLGFVTGPSISVLWLVRAGWEANHRE
ncbi:hypothetical protein E4U41_006602 [Claviceps citrina]|nr:hypothetical protein E4U41_006602 [Claviceps citrina]